MIHNEERSYLIERDPEMIQMVELVDKDIKTAVENLFHVFKKVKEKTECCGETWELEKVLNQIPRSKGYICNENYTGWN